MAVQVVPVSAHPVSQLFLLTVQRRTIRRSSRTDGCKNYADETISRPVSTNFTSHTNLCKGRPASEDFGAEKKGGQVVLNVDEPASGIAGQRKLILDFTQKGIQNPQQLYTKTLFRERFVKAVIRDDLPFRFGEGKGIIDLFKIFPEKPDLPSHQTVRRNLDMLHASISTSITNEIMVRLLLGQPI
jgi:hypothetical protein